MRSHQVRSGAVSKESKVELVEPEETHPLRRTEKGEIFQRLLPLVVLRGGCLGRVQRKTEVSLREEARIQLGRPRYEAHVLCKGLQLAYSVVAQVAVGAPLNFPHVYFSKKKIKFYLPRVERSPVHVQHLIPYLQVTEAPPGESQDIVYEGGEVGRVVKALPHKARVGGVGPEQDLILVSRDKSKKVVCAIFPKK